MKTVDRHLHPDHTCEICAPHRPANSALWGPELGRRDFFKIAGTGVAGYFLVPTLAQRALAAEDTAVAPKFAGRARNLIFILLPGAPSHSDTFDLKVGSWTPTDFAPEVINGVLFPKGLMPTLAGQMDKIGIVRSLRAPALAHGLQQTWVQIARSPASATGRIAPNLNSVVALEFERQRQANQKLPGFVSLNTGGNLIGAGYFNPRYTPFDVTASAGGLTNLINPAGQTTFERRYQMLLEVEGDLRGPNTPMGLDVVGMDNFYAQSRSMMYNPEIDAIFKFTTADQNRYGTGTVATGFGNSCVVARNLLKANLGTRAIQINLGGWDNHANIYTAIRNPALQLDRGLGNLIADLSALPASNGVGTLLDETLIVAMGEFGRTVMARDGKPGLNDNQGRDHYFNHFAVFAGGGVVGGRTIGKTSAEGATVVDAGWSQNRPAVNEDIAATIYSALGIDYTKTLRDDPLQRGFEYVPFASQGAWYPITELFTRTVQRGDGVGTRGNGRLIG